MTTSVSLVKGSNVSLSKVAPGLKRVRVGLGWDANSYDGSDFDLDASMFLLSAIGKVRTEKDFIFYGNLQSTDGTVKHSGDNLTGSAEGDDETLFVQLDKLAADVDKVTVTVTIYDYEARKQNFGQVKNAYIHLVDDETGVEVLRYDLGEDFSTETAIVFGEFYRKDGEWKFRAVGQGYAGGLRVLATERGINVA
jgi:tellurium resistance protein TerD